MSRQAGFSLVELVLVLVLTGILAVVAIPRLQLDVFDLAQARGELVDAIRYAQSAGMAHSAGPGYQVVVSGTGYTVREAGGGAVASPFAAGSYSSTFNGVAVSPTGTVTFDGMGRPAGGGSVFTLSAGGESQTVQVEEFTGYVR